MSQSRPRLLFGGAPSAGVGGPTDHEETMTASDADTLRVATSPPAPRRSLAAILRGAWHHPLERNALALMSGTLATALIGVVFWTAAAHYYATAEVGRASAVISTAAFLGNLSHLNLGNVYARFLPAAGLRTPALVHRGMLATAALALVLGTGFVLLWQSEELFTSTTERALFPLCVAVLTLFTLQDPLLVGLRAAPWIPVKNLSFSIGKLIVLIALAGVLPRGGLVVAWMLPAALAVVGTVVGMQLVWMPRHVDRRPESAGLPPTRDLVSYAGAELTTGLMIYIVPMVLPLIVIAMLGDEANAYFAIPYVISSALTMLTWNVAVSFVVEAATDERRTWILARRSLRLALLVAVAGMVTLLVGAPLILRIFGGAYADHGATLLRLMALAAPATVITTVYTSVLRVRRKVRWIVVVQILVGSTVIVLSALLIHRLGVTGVGVAYLLAEGVAGAALAVPLVRSIRKPPGHAVPPLRSPSPTDPTVPSSDGDLEAPLPVDHQKPQMNSETCTTLDGSPAVAPGTRAPGDHPAAGPAGGRADV